MRISVVPLTTIFPGKKAKIVSLIGGRGLREHLVGMGLNVGEEIKVLKQGSPGPLLVAVKETRLAIGQGVAWKIMVSVKV